MAGLFGRPELKDIRPYLERKYAVQEEEARAATTSAGAQATQAAVQESLAPSRIGLDVAQTRGLNVQSDLLPAESRASNWKKLAEAQNILSEKKMRDVLRGGYGSDLASRLVPDQEPNPVLRGLGYFNSQ